MKLIGLRVVEILLLAGADPNDPHYPNPRGYQTTPLDSGYRGLPVVELLLRYGANPLVFNDRGCNYLHMLVEAGSVDALRYLLNYLIDNDMDCAAQLEVKVKKGMTSCSELTPLSYAINEWRYNDREELESFSYQKTAALLLEYGAKPEVILHGEPAVLTKEEEKLLAHGIRQQTSWSGDRKGWVELYVGLSSGRFFEAPVDRIMPSSEKESGKTVAFK